MKAGIITILKVGSYGAELQAYALQAALRRMGCEAEVIDYLFYKNAGFRRTRCARPLFPFTLRQRLAETLYPLVQRIKSVCNGAAARRRAARFESFHRQHTALSPMFRTIDALYAAPPAYDVYITGSDQVWNPGIYANIAPYFLDFAPEDCRRVAYAASFGVERVPECARPVYRRFLSRYAAIGVRERQGVDLVRTLSDKAAQWVLDPTLLLCADEWLQVAEPVDVAEPYVLIYELTPCPYISLLARHIATARGCQLLRVCKSAAREDKGADIRDITDAGPAEFLWLVAHAAAVVTNSFHGTAFSLNFRRPFYTVLPLRKRNNSRQRSLLALFGMESRLITEGDPLPAPTAEPDFAHAAATHEAERDKSLKFLHDAIYGKPE